MMRSNIWCQDGKRRDTWQRTEHELLLDYGHMNGNKTEANTSLGIFYGRPQQIQYKLRHNRENYSLVDKVCNHINR